jgi:hypothetical protein
MDPRLPADRGQLDWFGARVVHVVTADECAPACPISGAHRVVDAAGTCGMLAQGEGRTSASTIE